MPKSVVKNLLQAEADAVGNFNQVTCDEEYGRRVADGLGIRADASSKEAVATS